MPARITRIAYGPRLTGNVAQSLRLKHGHVNDYSSSLQGGEFQGRLSLSTDGANAPWAIFFLGGREFIFAKGFAKL